MSDRKQTLLFSTDVTTNDDEEFVIEFYQCLMDDLPEKFPYKVTKNFDELIDFFEELE
ncbi:hypothetical protein [Neobacillus sp. DY30]|uniref:hypothetical protein n=1 Tax=Neobacillus sp. DY30 TaxID=3047871 RepID=UPI0024C026A7|nr:hypothetical protein [Neobacillus sp. DY30]WHX98280.1 hypothetical protein QNH29_16605 [Neobacillus sp. DY30]